VLSFLLYMFNLVQLVCKFTGIMHLYLKSMKIFMVILNDPLGPLRINPPQLTLISDFQRLRLIFNILSVNGAFLLLQFLVGGEARRVILMTSEQE
jgi:hypothetical protein